MGRTIRRYESRKLYDPQESRYVSLQEIAQWIREGDEIEVVDNASGESVTTHTLAQIILEEGRSGRSRLPSEILHDLVRVSGERIQSGMSQVQKTANRLMTASLDRLPAVQETRSEIRKLKERLARLEGALAQLEPQEVQRTGAKRTSAKKTPAKKAGTKRASAKRTEARRPAARRAASSSKAE